MGCNLGMDLKRGLNPGREKQKETVTQHIHTCIHAYSSEGNVSALFYFFYSKLTLYQFISPVSQAYYFLAKLLASLNIRSLH